MTLRRWLRTAVVAVGLLALLAVPAGAELFFEAQIWGEEFEDGPALLPKLELFQTISDKRFAAYEEVVLVFQIEIENVPAAVNGMARTRAKVFKADGTKIRLPMLRARVQDGFVQLQTPTAVSLERGDVIRWRVRLRDLPEMAQNGACQIVVGVASQAL